MKEFINNKKGKIVLAGLCVAIIVIGIVIAVLFAGNEEGFRTIRVSEIFGTAKATHNEQEYDAYKDMSLQEGYTLQTDKASYVRMILDDDKYIKLEESSKAIFQELGSAGSDRTSIVLEHGAITNEVTKSLQEGEEYTIKTPNSVLAIKGTFFRVELMDNESGEVLTKVYTYGGAVTAQRIQPNGEVVGEEVLIQAGYKTTISTDVKTEQIKLEDIPDSDLVDMYVAASNGHEMYLDADEIWNAIDERGINIEDYTSNRDGGAVIAPEGNGPSGGETTDETELTTDIDLDLAREWCYVLDTCYDENGEIIIHADLTRYEERDIPSAEFDINKYIEMYKAHGYSYDGDESDLLALSKDLVKRYGSVYYLLVPTDPVLLQEIADGVVDWLIESGQKNPPTEDEMDAFNSYVESIKRVARNDLAVGLQISYNESEDTYSVWMYGRVRFDGKQFINFTENAEWSPQWLAYVEADRIWLLEWDVEY